MHRRLEQVGGKEALHVQRGERIQLWRHGRGPGDGHLLQLLLPLRDLIKMTNREWSITRACLTLYALWTYNIYSWLFQLNLENLDWFNWLFLYLGSEVHIVILKLYLLQWWQDYALIADEMKPRLVNYLRKQHLVALPFWPCNWSPQTAAHSDTWMHKERSKLLHPGM
jgi:hypothetical protein